MSSIIFRISYTFLFLFSLLPFRVIYWLSDGLYLVLYHVIGYRRKVVRANLQNSFPEKSESELLKIEKSYFRYLADNMLEGIKMLSMSEKSIRKRFTFKGETEAEHLMNKGQSILLATSHYGNWEWGALGVTSRIKHPTLIVYKPLTNKKAEEVFTKLRSQFGAVLIPMKQTVKAFVEEAQKHAFMGVLVSDQTPTRHDKNYFMPFLNQPTSVFQGLEKIAKLTGSPIFYVNIVRLKRGYYEAQFEMMVANPKDTAENEITEIYNRRLEAIIRKQPEFWLWSHKRWKHQPPKEYYEKHA